MEYVSCGDSQKTKHDYLTVLKMRAHRDLAEYNSHSSPCSGPPGNSSSTYDYLCFHLVHCEYAIVLRIEITGFVVNDIFHLASWISALRKPCVLILLLND